MNRNQKTRGKMDNDNDSMDDSNSASVLTQGMHVMTTRSSARLLEKLQKLKETPTTTDGTPMECKIDDIKKRTRATGVDNLQVQLPAKPNQTPTPEAKRSRNDTTPPSAKIATAVFQEQVSKEEALTEEIEHEEQMDSIPEEEAPTAAADKQASSQI